MSFFKEKNLSQYLFKIFHPGDKPEKKRNVTVGNTETVGNFRCHGREISPVRLRKSAGHTIYSENPLMFSQVLTAALS